MVFGSFQYEWCLNVTIKALLNHFFSFKSSRFFCPSRLRAVNKMAGDIAMSQVRASVAESVSSIKAAPNAGRA
jgi:hypothetical protein